jgi:hypothetical protein
MAASSPPPSSSSPPWWAHVVIGGVVIAAGLLLYKFGATMIGTSLVVAGVAFLGVGAGVAASS